MLDTILREARNLVRAQAGTLHIVQNRTLRAVAIQNDALAEPSALEALLEQRPVVDQDSLAAFVAASGEMVNLADAASPPQGAPYRVERAADAATGYRTRTLLAIPLLRPQGECVGVLELANRLDDSGQVVAFSQEACQGIRSLAAMAAVTVHNLLLQDQLHRAQLDCIVRLSVAAEFRDEGTAEHIRRISSVSAVIARTLGLPSETVGLIEAGAAMHDIGKISVPESILLKPGPLTPQEREIVETHATTGAQILRGDDNELIAAARDIALTHHERWDGKGYPRRLAGEDIPLAGRIVGLADVFDALVSRRSYKQAYPLQSALEIIRQERGRHFDPAVTDAFFEAINEVLDCYSTLQEG
jgi:HD-GYP domain-containing protein (c-di-GMP phosphodiesterase class II)